MLIRRNRRQVALWEKPPQVFHPRDFVSHPEHGTMQVDAVLNFPRGKVITALVGRGRLFLSPRELVHAPAPEPRGRVTTNVIRRRR